MTGGQPTERGPVVIAIDGPSGVGKSTVARRVAQALGYLYVDSGSLYRAMGWVVNAAGLALDQTEAMLELARRTELEITFRQGQSEVWANGECITSQLRDEAVSVASSAVATAPGIREVITELLRRAGAGGDVVMEGRDIGTVVFPNARFKFFLDGSLEERARRRYEELRRVDPSITLERVRHAVAARDEQDRTRAAAPLRPAATARCLDTTDLTIDDVVERMLGEIRSTLFN